MGAYLTKPNREKISEDSENYRFSVGASSMQGWRLSQEDAHNAILSYDTGCSLFAVYDGHGGHEVAAYTALHLPEFIKSSDEFKNGDFQKALEESFIRFDETLTQAEVIAILKKLMNKDEELEDADPNEVDHLYQEATMPIEDVIARFKEGEVPSNKNLEQVEAAECSSKRKPLSPFLSAKRISSAGNGLNKHIRFGENGEHSGKKEEGEESSEVQENKEEKNGDAHENGEGKPENNSMNGDKKEVKEEEADMTNGSETVNTPTATPTPVPKGKGKGKGKGKSNQIASKPKVEEETTNTTEEATNESSTDESKKKSKKSAEELYQNMLTDGNDEGSSDEDDEDAFPNAQESSDDDDDDDEELDGDNDIDEEEDSEPDTEDDEEDEEGEMMDPCQVKEEPGNDSGCTAVVALIVKDELFVANAGDSRCVVCRNGEAIEMSMDHKPEDDPEKERIEKAGGKVTADGRVGGGLNLSRALGDHAYKLNSSLPLVEQMISPQPDIRTLKVDPKTDSFIILACDGIWNSMSSQEVVDFVRPRIEKNPDKISSICEELFDACLAPDTSGDGTGCDNMTAVIIKVKDSYNPLNEASSCKRSPSSDSESIQVCKRHKSDADHEASSSSTSEIKDTTTSTTKVEEVAAGSSS